MNKELLEALTALCREKGVSADVILDALDAALVAAYKKNFNSAQNVEVAIDRETGSVKVMAQKTVVEEVMDPMEEICLDDAKEISGQYQLGDVVNIEVTPKNFGRIAAMTAKQVVTQRLREAERGIIYSEYMDKTNELVTGTIARIERGNVFVDIGKIEAILPLNEQVDGEIYEVHNQIRCYVSEVKNGTKGTQIILSRSHPGLVKRLFETEVPEIAEGIVEIKSIAREAGSRTKMAVWSNDKNVDPVGACVGLNGARVNAIVNDLKGEKIDIINWDDNPAFLIENALSPAKVILVAADEEAREAQVIVPDYQLSLAIGKEGQNARLAARLTGFKIDIKSETQARESGLLDELESGYEEGFEGYTDDPLISVAEEDAAEAAENETAEGTEEPAAEQE